MSEASSAPQPAGQDAATSPAPFAPQDASAAPSGESRNQTGLKALIAVARQFDLDWSLARLIHIYGGETEPDARRLEEIARNEGLSSTVCRTNWGELEIFAASMPVIARLGNGAYVVVLTPPARAEGSNEETITIFNPRVPDLGTFALPCGEFETHWTGEILLSKRARRLGDTNQAFGLRWFIPEIWRQRPLFGNVVLAALIIHVLALAVPIFFQLVIDKVLVYYSLSTLTVLGIGVLVAILFDATLNWLRGYFLLRASSRMDIRLARTTFGRLVSLPISFFEHLPAGVITKHMQQASQIREFLTGRLLMTLLDLPALLIFLPILIYYSGTLTVIVLGITFVLGMIIAVMIGPYRRRLRELYRAEAGRQSLLVECIHGMRTVKSLNLESRRQDAWESSTADAIQNYVQVGKISLFANTVSQFIERGLTIAIVVAGSFAVFSHRMTVGELVAFNMLSTRVISPVLQVIGLLNNYQETLMSVEMLGEVMDRTPEQTTARGLMPAITGRLSFDDLTFSYSGSVRPAIRHFSADVAAGSVIGIVGRSGSGKTTLSALLQGLYVPSDGAVRIDGHNIQDFDLAYLRGQIGVVTQEPFLFRGTVKDNIRMGQPTASFEEVVEAARSAGADEFIADLPRRYDTELEEGGVNLSGGQKQRLCIARALLRDPRIIIFDEATSALDPESEAVVVRNLSRITRGRTTIIISHRLQTIRNADAIMVVDAGQLSDMGKHAELLERNLLYRLLWAQQTGRPT